MNSLYPNEVDGDHYVTCPYDASHRIRELILPKHLMKCRQNHPGQKMVSCMFNKCHVIPKPEMAHHLATCPSRHLLDRERQKESNILKGNVVGPAIVASHLQQSDEDWDREVCTAPRAMFSRVKESEEDELVAEKKPFIPIGANYKHSGSTEENFRKIPFAPSKTAQMACSQVIPSAWGRGRGRGSSYLSTRVPGMPILDLSHPVTPITERQKDWTEENEIWCNADEYPPDPPNRFEDHCQEGKPDLVKSKRKLQKKLKQISVLEQKVANGEKLSSEEKMKVQMKGELMAQLEAISTH